MSGDPAIASLYAKLLEEEPEVTLRLLYNFVSDTRKVFEPQIQVHPEALEALDTIRIYLDGEKTTLACDRAVARCNRVFQGLPSRRGPKLHLQKLPLTNFLWACMNLASIPGASENNASRYAALADRAVIEIRSITSRDDRWKDVVANHRRALKRIRLTLTLNTNRSRVSLLADPNTMVED